MEKSHTPALMPLEGAILPAIEMKGTYKKTFAALHAALERWPHGNVQPISTAPAKPRGDARALSRAAYAYALGKRKT